MARRRRDPATPAESATPPPPPAVPPSPAPSIDGLVPLPPRKPRSARRTWPQRLVLGFNSIVAVACLVSALTIFYANNRLGSRKLVDISAAVPAETTVIPTVPATAPDGGTIVTTTEPEIVVPAGDVGAKNFLLTASDARQCIDPNSPDAGAYLGSGADIGERADTIMMLRIDTNTNQAAVLSFPRDLWVRIGTSNRKSRINSTLDSNDPQKIIDTIFTNFGLQVDHLISVDFCAFKGLVDAVGGVAVPFEYAARDKATGLDVPAECHLFTGDEALRYVRSRKYQYFDPAKNEWVSDGTSDLGRITRQQDFLKRTLQKALDKGARDIRVANRLIDTSLQYVVTDTNLTPDVMLQVANAMKDFDPATVATFQIEGRNRTVQGNSVLEPIIDSENMQAVLAVFRGEARIADASDFVVTDPNASTTTGPTTTVDDGTTPSTSTTASGSAPVGSTTTTTTTPTGTTLPIAPVAENVKGLYPPRDLSCR